MRSEDGQSTKSRLNNVAKMTKPPYVSDPKVVG